GAKAVVGGCSREVLLHCASGGEIGAGDGYVTGGGVGCDRDIGDAFSGNGAGEGVGILSEGFTRGDDGRGNGNAGARGRLSSDGQVCRWIDGGAGIEGVCGCIAGKIRDYGTGRGHGGGYRSGCGDGEDVADYIGGDAGLGEAGDLSL